jgi:hypothetical protein
MAGSSDMARVAAAVGYAIPEDVVDDYTKLLEQQRAAFEAVSAMEGKFLRSLLCHHIHN